MRHEQTAAKRIIEVVSRSHGCSFEEVTLACPSLTWNQVFIEIDRLRRKGMLLLERIDPGMYIIHLAGKRLKRSGFESS